jgi:RNA polymerase sigma-70 factor (ECF subfamily)
MRSGYSQDQRKRNFIPSRNIGNKIVIRPVLYQWGFVSVLDSKRSRFESSVSPHLDAAYNLARWLTRNEHDAEDVVQEAMLRAFTFFEGFRGVNARSWLLKIVRNTCFTWLETNRPGEIAGVDMDELEETLPLPSCSTVADNPETLALRRTTTLQLDNALSVIPSRYREVVVLREIEGLSYKEIATVIDAPIGTVMSRLARARTELRRILTRAQRIGGTGNDP